MHTTAWVLDGQNGIDSLRTTDHEVKELDDHDVLVQLHAASLNHRDIAISEGLHGVTLSSPVVPLSDGAGIVHSVGSKVTSFTPGDKVCTYLLPNKPRSEPATIPEIMTGLGHVANGALCTYGTFHESALVRMPEGLTFLEASTLPVAGLTAWNALFGLKGADSLKKGDIVLVQGTGGVSIYAMKFALAIGATVIATTSSQAKEQKLRELGAHHILNYKTDPNWGESAKKLTPDGKGVHIIVDVGGLSTLTQSLEAVRPDGLISVCGLLGESKDVAKMTILECLTRGCIARGVVLGTREQYEAMNRFVEEKGVKPVLDEKVFGFEEAKEAYTYLSQYRHFSKLCIRIQPGSE